MQKQRRHDRGRLISRFLVSVGLLAVLAGTTFGLAAEYGHAQVFHGDARVVIDDLGRVAILLDTTGDGRTEHAWTFSGKQPLEEVFDQRAAGVTVVFTGDRLTLSDPAGLVRVELGISLPERVTYDDPPVTLRVLEGIELIHQRLATPIDIDTFSPAQEIPGIWNDEASEELRLPENLGVRFYARQRCDAGGVGSTSCNVDCGQAAGCGVSCAPNHYACCKCGGLFTMPSCTCTAN